MSVWLGPRAPRRAAMFALAAMCALAGPAAALECPYPLGEYLLTPDARAASGDASDPDSLVLDLTTVGVQFSAGQLSFDPTPPTSLHYTYETEVDLLQRNATAALEVHVVAYKEFTTRTGWVTRPVFLSSADIADPVPLSDSTQPTQVAFGGGVWAAWTVGGHVRGVTGRQNLSVPWPDAGTYVVFRGNTNGTWGPITPLSPTSPLSVNTAARSAVTDEGAYFTYQSNAREADSSAFAIMGRAFNGRSLGAVEAVSTVNDTWSDEYAALASDGPRVAVAWASRDRLDASGAASRIQLRIRSESGGWGNAVDVAPAGQREVSHPSLAWHNGLVFVAWEGVDANLTGGPDLSIFLRAYDPVNGSLTPPLAVTDASFPGDETSPAIASFGGAVYLAWASNSDPAGTGALSDDLDTHMAVWSGGALGPVQLMDGDEDDDFHDLWTGFARVGSALVLLRGMNMNTGTWPEHNQRQLAEVVARDAPLASGISATFSQRSRPTIGNGTAVVRVRFDEQGAAAPPSSQLALETSAGHIIRLPAGFREGDLRIPYPQGGFDLPTAAYWCGVEVPLTEGPAVLPPEPGRNVPLTWIGAAALGAAVLAGLVAVRRRRIAGRMRRAAPASADRSEEE